MKTIIKIISILSLSAISLYAGSADHIVKKMEANTRVTNASQSIVMEIQTSRGLRTMKMHSWNKGTEKSFILIDYPKKDKGITFLKLDKQMWQYIPKIEKVIKIPASMMMQSWMGSDFSNDDMVKESSMTDDYDNNLLGEDDSFYTIELIPYEDAAVVWGKIIAKVQKKTYAPVTMDYYDEDGILERTLDFKDVKKIDKYYYPHTMIMRSHDEDKKNNITTVKLADVNLNPKLKDSMFTKRALKRLSR